MRNPGDSFPLAGNTIPRPGVPDIVEPENLSASDRYRRQAEEVMRLAAKADSPAEKEVYLQIAEGWRKLAAEALRNERQDAPRERRSFERDED